VLSDGPVGYFRFGEASTVMGALDETAHHTGDYRAVTVGAPGAIAGDSNTAVQLPGSPDSEVYFGDIFDFAGNAPFSFELWMRPTMVDSESRRIFEKSSQAGGYTAVLSMSNGLIVYRDGTGNTDIATLPVNAFPLNAYTHVVVTYDGARLKMYRNGIESDSQPATTAIPDTDVPLIVGQGFAGSFDELAIYDKALSLDRIGAHYRAGAGTR
jgi:hypothetical protein